MILSRAIQITRSKTVVFALLLSGAALVAAGCGSSVTSSSQVDAAGFGTLTLTTKVCRDSSGCSDKLTEPALELDTPQVRSLVAAPDSAPTTGLQRMIGYRIANDLEDPASLRVLDDSVTGFQRDDRYSAELERIAPSGADTRWVGYVSTSIDDGGDANSFRVTADFGTAHLSARTSVAAKVVTGQRFIAGDVDVPGEVQDPFKVMVADAHAATSLADPIACGDLGVDGDSSIAGSKATALLVGFSFVPMCINEVATTELPIRAVAAVSTTDALLTPVSIYDNLPPYVFPTADQMQAATTGTVPVRTIAASAQGIDVTVGDAGSSHVVIGVGLPGDETRSLALSVDAAFAGSASIDRTVIDAPAGVTSHDVVVTARPSAAAAVGASSVTITVRSGDTVVRSITVPVNVKAVVPPAPAPSAPSAGLVRDTTPPGVTFLDWVTHRNSNGLIAHGLVQRVHVSEPGTIVGTLTNALPGNATARAKSRVTVFARGTFKVTRAGDVTLTLKAMKAGKAKIVARSKARSFRARLTLTMTDAAGNTRLVRRLVWVDVPASHG